MTATHTSLVVCVWMSQRAPRDAFYLSWFRFWQLGAGVLLFQLWQARKFGAVAGSLLVVGLAAALAHVIVDQRDALSLSVVSHQAADWSTGHPDAVPRQRAAAAALY